jgi:hypothetical protein
MMIKWQVEGCTVGAVRGPWACDAAHTRWGGMQGPSSSAHSTRTMMAALLDCGARSRCNRGDEAKQCGKSR